MHLYRFHSTKLNLSSLLIVASALALKYIINTLVDSVLVVPAVTQLQQPSDLSYSSEEGEEPIEEAEDDEEQVEEEPVKVNKALSQRQYYKLETSLISILLPTDGPLDLDQEVPAARRRRDWQPKSLEATRSMSWRLAADSDEEE